MMTNFIKINLAELSEETLNELSLEINREMQIRIQARVALGDFPPISEQERYLVCAEKKVEAIKAYRARTGYGLRESKAVIDNFQEYIRENS